MRESIRLSVPHLSVRNNSSSVEGTVLYRVAQRQVLGLPSACPSVEDCTRAMRLLETPGLQKRYRLVRQPARECRLPPEATPRQGRTDESLDMWSFGVDVAAKRSPTRM